MQILHTAELSLDRYLAPFRARRLAFYRFDVVVLGSGVAGSSAALSAAEHGASVALVAKDLFSETNTHYAQGVRGVACGISDVDAVERVIKGGPEAIERLVALGAEFDRDANGGLDLSREGGHSKHRIVHAGGAATGIEIQRTLSAAVRASDDISVFEKTFAIDLLSAADGRVIGALCRTERGDLVAFSASQVVLATGGAGQVFRETTNPAIATGDGTAMGFRAGARLRDMEFFQFHPTCLYIAGAARVLVSEIVRGAGGILLDRDGVRFMPEYHESAELAPRDVVSRACFDRMVKTGDTNVYLDLSDLERDPHELFPGISRICRYFSIDIGADPIPVRPGAHYMIGGLEADPDGRTNVPGLWAVGECASSGLHGANRMGSNSLLEGLVLGTRAGQRAATEARGLPLIPLDPNLASERSEDGADVRVSIQDMTYSLKSLMWRQLGIVRSGPAIQNAIERIDFWTRAVLQLARPEPRTWELLNMLTLSRLMAASAIAREESRGTHYRSDFPETSSSWRAHTILSPELANGSVVGAALTREPVGETVAAR